jgi:phage baseplate assembly protein W
MRQYGRVSKSFRDFLNTSAGSEMIKNMKEDEMNSNIWLFIDKMQYSYIHLRANSLSSSDLGGWESWGMAI